jgi:WD40 repeat protein
LITAGEDLHINLTDVETMKRKQTLTGHSDWITSLSINMNAKAFVTASLDKQVKVWDLNSGKCVKTTLLSGPLWGVAFSPTGDQLVTASQDGTISLITLQL